ncbi:MAG: aldo/keto reductase [Lachnospiraceae bacterium]|nr:aldo/keto reductase [Lachnospiraceae bacterium]
MIKLCLGTVQFGMKYGINNQSGQPSEEECFEMLDIALENGIKTIDTARAYGTAETIVGNYLEYRNCKHKVEIISKLCPNVIEANEKDVYSVIRKELEGSLKRLHISQLNGYLLHTPEYIYNEKIIQTLFRLKNEKLIQNIGVSIYDIKEGDEAIKKNLDYVQLPYSILDQRGMESGFIERAKKSGLTVFTRSAFLQGLFLMNLEKVPNYLEHAKPYLEFFESLTKQYNKSKIELLIHYVKDLKEIDYLVFGVDNKNQLIEDMAVFNSDMIREENLFKEIKKIYNQVDNSIILPSLWSNGKKVD